MPHPDAKERLARALRDALTTVPLSKVTVSGITRTAGVTRQAFYYHFSDIRDLTVWAFKREVADQIIAHTTYEDWSDGLLAMFVWMQKHPDETRCVVSSLGHFTLAILGHVSQWLATGMSTDPYILTERIARVLDGQVRRSLEALAANPIPAAQRT